LAILTYETPDVVGGRRRRWSRLALVGLVLGMVDFAGVAAAVCNVGGNYYEHGADAVILFVLCCLAPTVAASAVTLTAIARISRYRGVLWGLAPAAVGASLSAMTGAGIMVWGVCQLSHSIW
jgi:hypothetical protein